MPVPPEAVAVYVTATLRETEEGLLAHDASKTGGGAGSSLFVMVQTLCSPATSVMAPAGEQSPEMLSSEYPSDVGLFSPTVYFPAAIVNVTPLAEPNAGLP